MKIVSTGSTYRIYTDDLKTYDRLPAGVYSVQFSQLSGFSLEKHSDMTVDEKIYGVHMQKVEKIMSAYELTNRNFGVILSGAKGIGKSLFSKLLANEIINTGRPVILVKEYIGGIADFLSQIDQDVMVLFDEFDKTYVNTSRNENDSTSPQNELLTLFDGVEVGKKLFVVTCNELTKLNDYLVNRPGRFHYHIRFDYPTKDEIMAYMEDKLSPEYHDEIKSVVEFSHKVSLNYDCLRAIAFELNLGTTFKEAIKDLNILNVEAERYNLTLVLTNGEKFTRRSVTLDLFDQDEDNMQTYWFSDSDDDDFYVEFHPVDAAFNIALNGHVVSGDKVRLHWSVEKPEDPNSNEAKKYKETKVNYILLERSYGRSIHYTV